MAQRLHAIHARHMHTWHTWNLHVFSRFPSDRPGPLITHNVQELRRCHGPSPQQRQGLPRSYTVVPRQKKGCLLGCNTENDSYD